MTAETLNEILQLVFKWTGISMGSSKKTLIQCRLRPRMRSLGINSYEKYIDYLAQHKSEVQEFINLVTTNETSFFRTQRVWDYFSTDFLRLWSQQSPVKMLKIWSAASSSGEEAHSIGILCEEHRQKHPGFDYSIFGSDISSEVISHAERGVYSGRSIESFKSGNPNLFSKYMEQTDTEYRVKFDFGSKIKFGLHNLLQPAPQKSFFNVVFLRNVLIYFELEEQKKVLHHIANSMASDGILVIGESESLSGLKTSFQYKLPLIYTNTGTL
ncbi:MAG: CheR family methyltransferase [Bdellovibrio sp.]